MLTLGLLVGLAALQVGCQATVGVGVGFTYPGPWGYPPYGGPVIYGGFPIYP
jgi:hypothetical protein